MSVLGMPESSKVGSTVLFVINNCRDVECQDSTSICYFADVDI